MSEVNKEVNEEVQKSNLIKVVFFDENSALEYLDIKKEGRYIFNEEEIKGKEAHIENENKAKIGIGGKASDVLKYFGLDARASTEVNGGFSKSNNKLFNSSISNTILTDFLKSVDEYANEVVTFVGYDFKVIDNSFAYIKTIAPILNLLKEGYIDKTDEFKDINIKEIESVLENSKGYFEFLAVKGEKEAILRLNTKELRNNYRFGDLQDMNLVFYGIKVGKLNKKDLKIENYFERLDSKSKDMNDKQEEIDSIEDFEKFTVDKESLNNSIIKPLIESNSLDLYDIILAGISNGKN